MPQGKLKVKSKLPESVRAKRKDKGPAISKRRNAPITPKKARNPQVQKLKKIITKTVNATAEEQLRQIALDGKKSLLSKEKKSSSGFGESKKSKRK